MTKVETLEEIQNPLEEHLGALKKFKYETFMRFNNTSNQEKQVELLKQVNSIQMAMEFMFTAIHEKYWELENQFNSDDEQKQKDMILDLMEEFRREIDNME